MVDRFHDQCGVFGVFGHPEAANLVYLGLHGLQHRGQESAGIVSSDGEHLHTYRQMGLVADVFTGEVLERLPGDRAIGHVRYSTTGMSLLKNAQPFVVDYARGSIAVSHNGNLVNQAEVRRELEESGSIFQSTMDTEVIIHLIAHSPRRSLHERIIEALEQVRGAYSLLFLTETKMVGVRDPHGFRPLVLGRLRVGPGAPRPTGDREAYVLSSETSALDLIEARYEREIEPGEIVVIDREGLHSYRPFPPVESHECIFEFVYFARPDSLLFGHNVYNVRKEMGRRLAREHRVEADMVVPVPDSGMAAAIGYAEEAGIPFEMGLIRSHYVGRTFIEPQDSIRHFGVKLKLNASRELIAGKRVVLVDDSIVRGTTSHKIVTMVRAAGASEVHVRICCPPTIGSCFYGIDTPTREELIASRQTVEQINRHLTSDTLGYLSLEGLHQAVGGGGGFCDACFSGNYPLGAGRESEEPLEESRQLHRYQSVLG